MPSDPESQRGELPPFALAVRGVLAERARRVIASDPEARLAGATSGALGPADEPAPARAGVLVALFSWRDEAHVWLIRRPEGLRSHSGQVALPGGKVEAGDTDIVMTALREAEEEIGLPAAAVEVLGLDDDFSTSTGYVITPVVGWLRHDFTLTTNPAEVARAFSAPLATFRGEGVLGLVPIEAFRNLARAYLVDGEVVWGATAHVVRTLARRLDVSFSTRLER